MWLHQCLTNRTEDEVAGVIDQLKQCSHPIVVDVTFSPTGTASLMHDVLVEIISALQKFYNLDLSHGRTQTYLVLPTVLITTH